MEQGRLGSRVLRMGTISYYNGDEVFDEPMRGYTPLPKEKGRE